MSSPRILLALVGDIQNDAHARTKYGLFADELIRQCGEVVSCDMTLRGIPRVFNALQILRPNLQIWRERFWKNIPAFKTRSRMVAEQVRRQHPGLILQVGVTFDATRYQNDVPVFIYTDYTAALSARHPETTRSPFTVKELQNWLMLEEEAYRRANHIFVRSHFVQTSLMRDYGIMAEKISVIGGGVNFTTLPIVNANTVTAEPLVLFIGKEFIRKGGDLLLQAFAIARQEVPAARLRIVTSEDIPAHLPLSGVEILPASWNRDTIYSHYSAADLFVLPSRLETWGDVLLEAMAFGLPCIGVESDAMSEIISAGESGLLAPVGDVSALSSALLMLLNNPELRTRMGGAGRQRIETNFTWERVVMQIHIAIQERKIS